MEQNKAINPREVTTAAALMPSRSGKIKKVIARNSKDGIGGGTIAGSGTVYVPTGETAEERTIRFHEALHAAHTPKGHDKRVSIDMMGQAMEDARLHRYCSKAATSEYTQARRDELVTALRDLQTVKRRPSYNLSPRDSLLTFRAVGILTASVIMKGSHRKLLESVLARLGDNTKDDFKDAIDLLSDLDNWDKARKILAKYFAKDFTGDKPKPPEFKGGDKGDKTDDDSSKPEDSEEELPEGDKPLAGDFESEPKSDDSPEDDSPESDKPEGDFEPDDSDEYDSDDGDSEDSKDSDTEDKSEEIESEEPEPMPEIAPAMKTKPPRKRKVNPEVYTADLTPACDAKTYAELQASHPLELRIRRLDMGVNRVKLSLGRRAPLPVISGRKIIASKLAGATINPGMRVFARSVSSGGAGTILIDASGSMSIPPDSLNSFLSNAPALTLGFYNAKDDNYYNCKHGTIFIYAANGYRANVPRITYAAIEDYGGGNLIDYQAIAWLIKQPAPRYLITDRQYTGPWEYAAKQLDTKLRQSGDIIIVRNLERMEEILSKLRK